MMPRIEPVETPYAAAIDDQLKSMMPPGVPPILLFRTFVRNPAMAKAMAGWGRYELSRQLSLSMRDRELIIDRTCAQCRCEYEWSVHVAFFAERVGLSADQVASITHGSSRDSCWENERDRMLIEAVDALHANASLDDDLYARLSAELTPAELLDLFMLCGWYHAISFAANACQVDLESGAPRFVDYPPPPLTNVGSAELEPGT
jgi:alkylhydroperoxidase family enzyme